MILSLPSFIEEHWAANVSFRPGKLTMDQTPRKDIRIPKRYAYHLFTDFKQAYIIERSSLFTILSFGIPSKLNRLYWLMLINTDSVVSIDDET